MRHKAALIAALIIPAVFLTSCTLSLTEQDGKLVDKKNGVTYVSAPLCYEPERTGEEVYATCKKLKLDLYEIDGLEPTEWLSEQYEGIGGVWHSKDTTLPDDITGFDADRMYICQEKVITVSLGTVDDKDDIDAVVKAFTEGEPVSLVQEGESYKLKFASDKYPGLYYNLMYIEGGDGNNYIYDRTTKTCVDVGDVLLDYLPR